MRIEIVKAGTWLYGGTVPRRVHIIKQDWDFYHEPDYEEDPPELNRDGEAYYFAVLEDSGQYARSDTFLTLDAVLEHAKSYGPIAWDS